MDFEEEIKKIIDMSKSYVDRQVDNYSCEKYTIDTSEITDCDATPYETAIEHINFNDGNWMIVEQYKTIEEAKIGHEIWVKYMEDDNVKIIFDTNVWTGIVTARERIKGNK